jgi:hypothetical protein
MSAEREPLFTNVSLQRPAWQAGLRAGRAEVDRLREALMTARRRIVQAGTADDTKRRGEIALDAICEIDTALADAPSGHSGEGQ